MRKIEVKIRQLIWSIKESFKITTYDLVIYDNGKYYIKSSLCGNNIWDLYEKTSSHPKYYKVNGDDLKLVNSFNRYIEVFKGKLTFQKNNWEIIDIKKPIGNRLSYINSDDIKF